MTTVLAPEETLILHGVSFETLEVPTATEPSLGFGGGYGAVRPGAEWSPYAVLRDRQVEFRGALSRGVGGVVDAWVHPALHLCVWASATSAKGVAAAEVTMVPEHGMRRLRGTCVKLTFEYHHGGVVEFGPDDKSNPDLRYRIRARNLRMVGMA